MMKKLTTKKMLVAYASTDPEASSSDFLAPINDTTGLFLFGLRSKKRIDQGQMVYIGREISINDVFARLVDSGRKIENVNQTLEALEAYLRMLQEYKIGNILALEPYEAEPCGFRLKKIAERAPVKPLPLP